MDYRSGEMAVFSTVAETGSFSAAGRRMRMTPSAVSKLIARLEARLGTSLFIRSTRRLQLTAEGELYLERVLRILAEIDEADRLVASGADAVPTGRLRVSASVAFGECCILPLVPAFLARYPLVELDISLTDTVVDLVDDRTDVAIRIGALQDSSLKARKLLETRRVIVAAPDYVTRHGMPVRPHDLADHNCLRFNFRRTLAEWPFRDPNNDETYTVAVSGNAHGNNGVVLRQLALGGLGLARLGEFHVADDIATGRLVPVLEAYNAGDVELIHAVFVGHEQLAVRVRAFVDFLAEMLRNPGG